MTHDVPGWTVHRHEVVASTNDLAAALRDAGAAGRTAVVADAQTAGRGRVGRRFASPPGGLYVSVLLDARAEDLPAAVVALSAVATAQAIDHCTGAQARIKWPNDVWIDGKKVAGVLLESSNADLPVVVGIGVNIRGVPDDLPPDVRAGTGALNEVGAPVERDALLRCLLGRIDAWQTTLRSATGRSELESAWHDRLALLGARVRCTYAGRDVTGVLEDVSLDDGLCIRDGGGVPVWRAAEVVQDLRPLE